jgi:hypothetical protein
MWKNFYLTHYMNNQSRSRSTNTKITGFYAAGRLFITLFKTVLSLTLSWARWILSTSLHSTFLRFVLISFSHLTAGLLMCSLHSGISTRYLHVFLVSHNHVTLSARPICLDLTSLQVTKLVHCHSNAISVSPFLNILFTTLSRNPQTGWLTFRNESPF